MATDRHKWITIREATQALGKSERTIWRWVDKGRLPIDRGEQPFVVDIGGELPDAGPIVTDTPDTLTERLTRLTAEVERLTADNARLTELFEEVRSERDYLRQVHAAALANTQRLIEAPRPRRRIRWPWQRED